MPNGSWTTVGIVQENIRSRYSLPLLGADLAYRPIAEQTIELPLGNSIAFARPVYQAAAIDHRHFATAIKDEARPLQNARRCCFVARRRSQRTSALLPLTGSKWTSDRDF
jgi:hypothetical protein